MRFATRHSLAAGTSVLAAAAAITSVIAVFGVAAPRRGTIVAVVSAVVAAWWAARHGRSIEAIARALGPSRRPPRTLAELERGVIALAVDRDHAQVRAAAAEHDARVTVEMSRESLASTIHDLRTPLTSVLATVEMVGDADLDTAPSEASELLEIARSACHHMRFLIDDLLDEHALRTGELQLDVRSFDVDPLLDEARRILEPVARSREIELVVAGAPGLVVEADRTRTLQVLFNLVGNALKYSPAHTRVQLWGRDADGLVRFEVADEGPGVPPEHRNRLFGRFVRIRDQRASESNGSGLGLHLSKSLVERMGGEIGYRARGEDGGSVFWFALPAVAALHGV